MDAALAAARAAGMRRMLLGVYSRNEAALRFYERLGFRFIETRHFNEDECFVYSLSREHYLDYPYNL